MKTKLAILTLLAWTALASAFYNPEVGRWLNRDPIGEYGGINLQEFAHNNAISLVDRSGLDVVALPEPPAPPPSRPRFPQMPKLPPTRDPFPWPPGTPPTIPPGKPPGGSGPAAACVAAALLGWEIGRAIDEAQENLISDFWGDQFANCYQNVREACRKPCPPCKPYPEGTRAYRIDRVTDPDSREAHYPWTGDHVHWYRVNQDKASCRCFWNKDKKAGPHDETEPVIPQGGSPNVPAGAIEVPPFPKLLP